MANYLLTLNALIIIKVNMEIADKADSTLAKVSLFIFWIYLEKHSVSSVSEYLIVSLPWVVDSDSSQEW